MTNPLNPNATVLCKLGSIAIHAQEFLSPEGCEFDKLALDALLQSEDIKQWLNEMDAMAMIPVRRNKP